MSPYVTFSWIGKVSLRRYYPVQVIGV